MRARKLNIRGEKIEETKYYVVSKLEDNSFMLYHKYNSSLIHCAKYVIAGTAVIYIDAQSGTSYYYNLDKMQKYGMGNSLGYIFEIDSWKTTTVNGEQTLMIKYLDEKDRKFIRCVDANGDLYKKPKKVQEEKETAVSL